MSTPQFTDDLPVALTIAGSDCSCGAGLQADLKTFTALGIYGLTAATCVVSEVPGKVNRIEGLPPSFLYDQVKLLCSAFPVRAVKTGLLHSAGQVERLIAALDERRYDGPLVVDPVMVASSGEALISAEARAACIAHLFPRATLLTPNLDEAATLLGHPLPSRDRLESAARRLCERFQTAILLKGGHLAGGEAVDILCRPGGPCETFTAPRIEGVSTHGTGCTLSAAITAHLALNHDLVAAVRHAKEFVSRAIATACRWNSPTADLHALNTSWQTSGATAPDRLG